MTFQISNTHGFQAGKSGNPKGRPPRKSFNIILTELLDLPMNSLPRGLQAIKAKIENDDNPTLGEAIMRNLIADAIAGDKDTISLLMNRLEGLPKESKEIDVGDRLDKLVSAFIAGGEAPPAD